LRSVAASFLALAGNAAGQIVSAIIAGRMLSSAALSVIGVSLPVYYAYGALGAMAGIGATAVCSRLIGEREFMKARQAHTLSYVILILFAIGLTVPILMFTDPIVQFLGASPDIFEETRAYVRAISMGGIFIMMIYPSYNLLRLDGRNLAAAVSFIIMAALNILLDLVFLIGLKSGVSGIAVATVLSSGVAGMFGNILLLRKSENLRAVRPQAGSLRLIRNILWAGSPGAMEYACFLFCALFINNMLVAQFGSHAISVYKVVDSVNSFALVVIWSFSGALVAFAGVFLAEKDTVSVKQLLALAFKRGGPAVLAVTVFCIVFADRIAALFGIPDAATAEAVRIFAFSLPLSLLLNIIIYIHIANHRAALANTLLASKLFVWIAILAYPLSDAFGLAGVWHSFWMSEAITLLIVFLASLILRHRDKNIAPLFLFDVSAERRGSYKAFIVRPTSESISKCAADIVDFAEANALSLGEAMRISLALEELLVVIAENCKPEYVNVRILIHDGAIILSLRNTGAKFNPVEYAQNVGGDKKMDVMGVNMVLKLAVSVDYRSTFGVNNNTIVLEKGMSA
jgi:Na+-driven multidrug efflux pump